MSNCTARVGAPAPNLPNVQYVKREIRYLGWQWHGDWLIKFYGIYGRGNGRTAGIEQKALSLASEALAAPDPDIEHHGVAIVMTHEGMDGNYIILDWWVGTNMLAHRIYRAPLDDPLNFRRFVAHDIATCVWESQVLAFEGRAWAEHILGADGQADMEAYAAVGLEAWL